MRSPSGVCTDATPGYCSLYSTSKPALLDRGDGFHAKRDVIDDGAFGAAARLALAQQHDDVGEHDAFGRAVEQHGAAAERDPEGLVGRDVANDVVQVAHRDARRVRRRELARAVPVVTAERHDGDELDECVA